MPNGEEPQRMGYTRFGIARIKRWVENRIAETRFGQLAGFRRRPQVSREGRPSAPEIREELKPLRTLNQNMLIKLKEIEEYWKYLDDLIWGSEGEWEENSIVSIYAKLSFLLDPKIIDDEISTFTGVSLDYPQKKVQIGTVTNPEEKAISQIELKERTFAYIESDG